VEVWRPYADRRLHEFMLAVPPELHFTSDPERDDGYAANKWLVRRAMRGILPESIRLRRTKTTFMSVFAQEVRTRWADYEAVFGPRGYSELVERGYIDRERFWARLDAVRDGVTWMDDRYVSQVVALESWLRSVTAAQSTTRAQPSTVPRPTVDTLVRGSQLSLSHQEGTDHGGRKLVQAVPQGVPASAGAGEHPIRERR
jgi:asparagine synthase (glutamine-hydrolysing)